jgi:hypothetical protein
LILLSQASQTIVVANGGVLKWSSIRGEGAATENKARDHEVIGVGVKTREKIALAFGMKEHISELHLALLEKAEMIEPVPFR